MIERPRGTRDFGPEAMAQRRALEAAFARVATRHGYREVATPTFEHAELFIAKSGPAIVDEMYVFEDKGGRRLALRPELTTPVLRLYYAELQSRPKPLKLYYLGRCYRYDEPQFGRYREFFQYGVEILGGDPLASDAEVIATAVDSVRETGFTDFEVRMGHVGLIRDALDTDPEPQARILNRLDKRDVEGLRSELAAASLQALEEPLLALVDLRGGAEVLEDAARILASAPGPWSQEGLDYLASVGDLLEHYGMETVTYDLGVVRGLDYYRGLVFELHDAQLGAASQICGGGSYSLATVFEGEPIFTTGFGMGFDRVLLSVEKAGIALPGEPLDAFVAPVGDHMRAAGYEVLRVLREAGIASDIDLVGRGPSKNLEYAAALGARHAILVGEAEWDRGKVSVKALSTGAQEEVELNEVADFVGPPPT